jgi:hypothetical protein
MIIKFSEFQLLLEKFEDNQIKKIKTFCNVPEIYNWAVEFSPKLSVWLSNVVKKLIIDDTRSLPNWIDPIKYKENLNRFFKGELKLSILDNTNDQDQIDKEVFDTISNVKFFLDKFTKNRTYLNQYTTILDWIRSPLRTDNVDISKLTLEEAYKQAEDWHKNLKASGIVANEEGVVFMTFSDGYYWIDLETNSCRAEADAMGHCATTRANTLLSLRKNQEPHVTTAFNYNGEILQSKGRGNEKPVEKYHKYIVELLCYPNVGEWVKIPETENDYEVKGFSYEYNPEDDFKIGDLNLEQVKYVYERNPKLFDKDFYLKYTLYKSKLMTVEELMSKNPYKDLLLIDGKLYFLLEEWGDITAFKKERNKRDSWIVDILKGEHDWNGYSEDLDFDYDLWDELSEGAYETIKEAVIGSTISIDDSEDEETYELTLNEENCVITETDILVKLEHDKTMSLGDILESSSIEKDGISIDSDDLEEVRDKLNSAYTKAKEGADESEAYDDIVKAIEYVIGKPKMDEKNEHPVWYTHKFYYDPMFSSTPTTTGSTSGMLIDLNPFVLELSGNEGGDGCRSILELINDAMYEDDLIDVNEPYYGWSGTVKAEYLSDEIENNFY